MNFRLSILPIACLAAAPLSAQHVQVTSVIQRPGTSEVWVANRGNDSVSVVDVSSGVTTHEIDVDVWPRSIAFNADGSKAFVANQRGNVAVTKHAATPFDGTEYRGSISVIDTATKTVDSTLLTDIGVEPFGLATAPNGNFFVVSNLRTASIQLFSTTAPYGLLTEIVLDRQLNLLPPGKTVSDVDSNSDGIPDQSEPRSFVIRDDNAKVFVAHQTSGFITVLDIALDGAGIPTGITQAAKVDMNSYAPHPILNPVPVQTLDPQGVPRFFDDIALSPDGATLLTPHVLHNLNHDVNFNWSSIMPGFPGDFANRVYPAISKFDTATNSFVDFISHDIQDALEPAEHIPYGGQGASVATGILTLGSTDQPSLGSTVTLRITGSAPTDVHVLGIGQSKLEAPSIFGTLLVNIGSVVSMGGSTYTVSVPNDPSLEGVSFFFQAGVIGPMGVRGLTNGLEAHLSANTIADDDFGYRAGQPGKLLYNAAGDRVVLLNRGSEDVYLFEVAANGDLNFLDVFPPRHDFVERDPLDDSTPLGDLPLGMTMIEDAATPNDDALIYVHNETSRTLSTLRVDFETGVFTQEAPQLDLLLGADKMSLSELKGQEVFEDASRAQTAGNFNNSCASCHFEGGADGNVWQRPDGPKTTMPVYGGPLLTGLLLWRGTRINLGETGPMFGGENGGHGLFDDTMQQALIDYHQIIPVPLNPNRDVATGNLTALGAQGQDLFHGTNETGTNPLLRAAGCATCHPRDFEDPFSGATDIRGFTADFLDPGFTGQPDYQSVDPNCFQLQENIAAENIRNVNSGVNVDVNFDGTIDVDRNGDGFSDIETYVPMNPDIFSIFTRDDPNGFLCPDFGGEPKEFERAAQLFSIPTKLGVFSTPPYMHDNSIMSLRTLLDPQAQMTDPQYGNPNYPGLGKFINEFHDIRGNDMFDPGASKVQVTLQTAAAGSTPEADIEALLAYIRSL